MSLPSTILKVDYDTEQSDFDLIYTLPAGYVFKYTKNPETLALRIDRDKPANIRTFRFRTVDPGVALYTLYGDNTLVVTENTGVPGYAVPTPVYVAPEVSWNETNAGPYTCEVSTASNFSTLVYTINTTGRSINLRTAVSNTPGTYYFRVKNSYISDAWSITITFTIS